MASAISLLQKLLAIQREFYSKKYILWRVIITTLKAFIIVKSTKTLTTEGLSSPFRTNFPWEGDNIIRQPVSSGTPVSSVSTKLQREARGSREEGISLDTALAMTITIRHTSRLSDSSPSNLGDIFLLKGNEALKMGSKGEEKNPHVNSMSS